MKESGKAAEPDAASPEGFVVRPVDLAGPPERLAGIDDDVLACASTLVDAFASLAERHGDRVALRILDRRGIETQIPLSALWRRSRRLHAHFAGTGLEPGRFVILALPTGPELIAAYFAALLAGGVPGLLPAPSNRFADRGRYVERVSGILENAGAAILYTEEETAALFRDAAAGHAGGPTILSPRDTKAPAADLPVPQAVDPTAVATVQYSSGTTGLPKGVLITHRGILHNMRAVRDALGITPEDVFVDWLPLYHDMGLMGAFLLPLLAGASVVLIPTLDFMKHPSLWLRAVHHYRGTVSWAPNFAYSYCAKRIPPDETGTLDLSSWKTVINASEPVLASTLEEFHARFSGNGLGPDVSRILWGMAETVLVATSTPRGRPRIETIGREALAREDLARPTDGDGLRIVSVGRTLQDSSVEIRDPAGNVLGERSVGRIWLRAPSLFVGYHRQPDATARALVDGWFDTGDRGYLADGELFFVSRDKDLVVIGGEKYPPHDIESVISEVSGVRRGCVAVFGLLDPAVGTEQLVAVVETEETDPETTARLRRTIVSEVLREVGLGLRHLLLVEPGSIEKTTSGKVSRIATREKYSGRILGPQVGGGPEGSVG